MMKEWACPRCGEPLTLESSWGGLVKRTPRECASCGAKLLYTTTGEVSVDEHATSEGAHAHSPADDDPDDD